MGTVTLVKQPLEFDEFGLMVNPDLWDESIAQAIAHQEEIGTLTEDHWKIIHGLREYFFLHGTAPASGRICVTRGLEQVCVHQLFGTCFKAWRIAGLPDPSVEAKTNMSILPVSDYSPSDGES